MYRFKRRRLWIMPGCYLKLDLRRLVVSARDRSQWPPVDQNVRQALLAPIWRLCLLRNATGIALDPGGYSTGDLQSSPAAVEPQSIFSVFRVDIYSLIQNCFLVFPIPQLSRLMLT